VNRILRPAEAPISEGDDAIAAALESASVPTLMMSLVHLTGDTSLLRGPIRPRPAVIGQERGQGALSPAERAEVRARALRALAAYRDAGCRLPPPPAPETVREMMSFLVGEPVPDEYVPMMLEEMALAGSDERNVSWDRVPAEARRGFRVLVIGAGMSGLLAAIRLEEAGIPYEVVEKNAGVGGTWYENTYPGCRVDVPNHFYCYSFAPNHDWSEHYSQQRELRAYFERCADEYGVRKHVRFETEVVAARFDEPRALWEVRLRGRDGREELRTANALVSAVGQLSRPKVPEIEGLASFAGPAFHSARWQPGLPLAGRRVAVIGTGASAFQLVPEVAREAAQLSVFQRSPSWMLPNPAYHGAVAEGKKWVLKHVPYYARWYRFLLFWPAADGLLPSLQVDPAWPHPERSVNALNEGMRVAFTDYLRQQVGDDPELLAKVVPSYPPFGKRMLQDNGSWLSTLRRQNVELVTERIARITPKGIVCEDGREHPADVIVFATGFHATRFLWPMRVRGRDGIDLSEYWGDDPKAYLGITMPGFPNLFCLYGPSTNLAHAGSIIFHSECQVRYVMGCIRALLERGASTLDCRPEVCDAYHERLEAALARTVWAHPGMSNWYKNARGKVVATSPWRLVDYWRWTREPDLADYHLS
jgi:4-hydroxyacetophenone monooxygenase